MGINLTINDICDTKFTASDLMDVTKAHNMQSNMNNTKNEKQLMDEELVKMYKDYSVP
jgi:hypothetical protein